MNDWIPQNETSNPYINKWDYKKVLYNAEKFKMLVKAGTNPPKQNILILSTDMKQQ